MELIKAPLALMFPEGISLFKYKRDWTYKRKNRLAVEPMLAAELPLFTPLEKIKADMILQFYTSKVP